MIRKSGIIAIVAVLLSLAVHLLLGLGITLRVPPAPQPSGGETTTEVAAPGTQFEDLVEAVNEPVAPEPVVPEAAAEPEPPVEAEPVPEPEDVQTSEVHIASNTPQQSRTPDGETEQAVEPTEETGAAPPETGDTPEPQTLEPVDAEGGEVPDAPPSETGNTPNPETVEPADAEESEAPDATQSETGNTPEPATVEPVGTEQGEAPDPALTPPPGTDAVTDIAQGEPSVPVAPSEAETLTTEVSPPTPTSTPETAALAAPVVAIPVTPSAPVVSLQPQTVEPETPLQTIEAAPDLSDTAVRTSLRPKLPTKRPTPAPEGASDSRSQTRTTRLAPAGLIESPLTAYKRNGSNIFGQSGRSTRSSGTRSRGASSGGTRSGGQGFSNSSNGGNSDRTNWAGLVLTQLNRTQPPPVSGRGWARVLFRINANGSLDWVNVIDSSGSSGVNRAAQQQVRSAGTFPRPPDGKAGTLNFFYRIR